MSHFLREDYIYYLKVNSNISCRIEKMFREQVKAVVINNKSSIIRPLQNSHYDDYAKQAFEGKND